MIISRLDSGTPDLNYCRLYQKFQMLNCCINHKKSNCAGGPPASAIPPEEDEFFDAEEEVEEAGKTHSAWNQPQGRKERTKMKLLNSPSDWIYAPITQDPLPMTEDMLEEQTEMMEQLGSDAEASELRARILSASLLSDMEAFKAANPGSVIEDFVRWHSPRDWIDDEDNVATDESKSGGHLSGRMQSPGNLWLEMWKAAKPVPSWRQKRLFDDTKEAEKILHTFSSLKPGQIARLMIPAVFHASIHRLLEELLILPEDTNNPMDRDVKSNCKLFISKIGQITRHWPLDLEQYEDALTLLQQSEIRLSQFKSLKLKLADCQEAGAFAARLMAEPDGVPLLGGSHSAVGSVLHKALENSVDKSGRGEQQQPVPSRKEFILRCTAQRPGNGSTSSCQRMYCCIDQDSFRLAGAFTQDTLFY